MRLILKSPAIVNMTHASGERVRHGCLTLSPEEANIISSSQQIFMRYNIELTRAQSAIGPMRKAGTTHTFQ